MKIDTRRLEERKSNFKGSFDFEKGKKGSRWYKMWCSTSTSYNTILEAGGNLPTTLFSEGNIISWNVWGFNRRDKRSIVKSLIKK